MSSMDGLLAVWRWYYTTLVDPPTSSWVTRTASTFYVLAVLIIGPMAFLTGLDVASWLIMRTMGTISADLPPAVVVHELASDEPTDPASSPTKRARRSPGSLGLNLAITPADAVEHAESHMFYGSPGDHSNAALAGDGIFSPIISRAGSPELVRRRTASGTASSTASSSFVDLGASADNLSPADGLRKRPAVAQAS